jgi:putative transposase
MISLDMKQMAVKAILEACDAGATERRACEVAGITCRTLRRWRESLRVHGDMADRRQQAANESSYPQALTEQERQAVLDTCNSPEFRSLPPSQIVPMLADRGQYLASESSFYRILRAAGQSARRGRAAAPRKIPAPKAFEATAPNQVWTWDITYLPTLIKGEFYRLYLVMDIFSRLIVGWEIHLDETAEHASNLIQKACLNHGVAKDQLVLHSDNGSPMKGATMLATLQRLGIMPSFSRPSVSDDNPYSESLFRTVKYCPAYPSKPFSSLADAQRWVLKFVRWYNTEHRHSGIQFVTPAQRHEQSDSALLDKRSEVYEKAKAERPLRWKNRPVRNWSRIDSVWLNPPKEHRPPSGMKMAA